MVPIAVQVDATRVLQDTRCISSRRAAMYDQVGLITSPLSAASRITRLQRRMLRFDQVQPGNINIAPASRCP